MAAYATPTHLAKRHNLSQFKCASDQLSTWLINHARSSHAGGHTRVAVVTEHGSDDVIGFYALAPGSVAPFDATERMRAGGGRHPVPVVVLARLAVHSDHAGRGLGGALLGDAVLRALAASQDIGGRALVVTCKDDDAKAFYLSQIPEFEELPHNPLQLALMFKDVRATLGLP